VTYRSRFLTVPARAAAAGLAATVMSLVVAPIASAAGTLDQTQPTFSQNACLVVDNTHSYAQTFTAGLTGTMDQVDLALGVTGSPIGLTVQITPLLPDNSGQPAPVPLTAATVLPASVSTTVGFVSVPLNPPAVSLAGTQYAIVLSLPNGAAPNTFCWAYAPGAYPNAKGLAWSSNPAAIPPSVPIWNYFPGNDFAFKTYVTQVPPAVPEAPFAFLLPLGGLIVFGAGFALTRRRRGKELPDSH